MESCPNFFHQNDLSLVNSQQMKYVGSKKVKEGGDERKQMVTLDSVE